MGDWQYCKRSRNGPELLKVPVTSVACEGAIKITTCRCDALLESALNLRPVFTLPFATQAIILLLNLALQVNNRHFSLQTLLSTCFEIVPRSLLLMTHSGA